MCGLRVVVVVPYASLASRSAALMEDDTKEITKPEPAARVRYGDACKGRRAMRCWGMRFCMDTMAGSHWWIAARKMV